MAHASDEVVRLAEVFGELARALASSGEPVAVLDAVVHLAVSRLDACEFAGTTFVHGRTITSPASSGPVPRILDRIQSETGEGPCVDAIRERAVFVTGDLRTEVRWPAFSRRAHDETGVCSVASLRLFLDGDTMGALNLYATAVDAFDASDVALGAVLAAHAAIALSSAQREAGLEDKARSRDVIGQAKGILMAREGVDESRAFDMLRLASQRMNVKVRDLSERLAAGEPLDGEAVADTASTASPGVD